MKILTKGELKFGPGIKAAVWLDPEIAKYYLSLVPKYYGFNPQKYPAHITVVRLGVEIPLDMTNWGRREGEIISVEYENDIQIDERYCWLTAHSETIAQVREELGLPKFRLGFSSYHLTIGNRKDSSTVPGRLVSNSEVASK